MVVDDTTTRIRSSTHGVRIRKRVDCLHQPFFDRNEMGNEIDPPWRVIAGEHGIDVYSPEQIMKNGHCGWLKNLLASFLLAMENNINLDSLLGCGLAVAALFFFEHTQQTTMNWLVVSLVVIFPISQGIGMAFKRRELGLREIGFMFGNLRALWGAAHCWKIKSPEGSFMNVVDLYEAPDAARESLRELFEEFLTALVAYLNIPRWGHARQQVKC